MGDHAGESVDAIFGRKIADIGRVGKTYWLINSPKAQPDFVQRLCRTIPVYVLFISPATKGGARATVVADSANEYSDNREMWYPFPKDLSPVTGKLCNRASALVLNIMEIYADTTIDLWNYADFTDVQKPVMLTLGCSTICTVRKDTSFSSKKMKSRFRKVVAIARLAAPYCVWVRFTR